MENRPESSQDRESRLRSEAGRLTAPNAEGARTEDRLALLAESSRALLEATDVETALDEVLVLARRLLPADACAVWRLDPVAGQWRPVRSRGLSATYQAAAVALMRHDSPSLREPLVVADAEQEAMLASHREAQRAEGIASLLVVPLILRGESTGTVAFYHRRPHAFAAGEVRIASALACLSAAAIDNAERREQERRHAEQAEQARRRLEMLVEQSPLSVQVLSPEGYTLQANPAWERLWETSRDHLVGHSSFGDPQLDSLGLLAEVRAAFAGEARKLAPCYYDPGRNGLPGRPRWVEADIYPVKDSAGAVTEVVLLLQDVTSRVNAAETLRFQAQLLDSVEQAVIATDLEGRITYWNGYAAKLYGWSAEEVLGRTILDVTPADLSRDEAAAILGRLREGERWVGEFTVRRRDGTSFPAWVRDFPIRGASGEVVGIVGVSEDMTERKRLEQDLRDRAAALAAADRSKDEFLAMLAHELRNPLAPIRTAVEVMRRRGIADPGVARAREVIERQVGHLTRLVDDLLDVSRITRGKIELRRERVDLRDVARRALESARPALTERHHRWEALFPEEVLWVNADPLRLEQVVVNLLNNAAKYTEAGGEVTLAAAREGAEVVLRVRDNGIGIAPDLLPRLFDLFAQAERSLDRSQGGLGIGLTLVRRLVELHGGSVEASSEGPGRGSEFRVRLPVEAPGATPAGGS